jgi:hypothetical protein
VRVVEALCPFCDKALPADLGARAVPAATRRLDRLATFTFAASLAVAACGGKSADVPNSLGNNTNSIGRGSSSNAGPTNPPDNGSVMPMYGIAAPDAGPADDDGGSVYAMYGLPAPDDAGPADFDAGSVHAMYGLPAPEDAGACFSTADCPPNPAASCAQVCADGTNPCVHACVEGLCVPRGCPPN